MKRWLLTLSVLLASAAPFVAWTCQPAWAVETFDEAWQTRWRPQVTGSLLSRRFEPQIRSAAKEIWDVAQANAVATLPKPAGPLVVKPKAPAKAQAKASAKSRAPSRPFSRRRVFRRR